MSDESKQVTVDELTVHLDKLMSGIDERFAPLGRLARFFWSILAFVAVGSFWLGGQFIKMSSEIADLKVKAANNDKLSVNVGLLSQSVNILSDEVKRLRDEKK